MIASRNSRRAFLALTCLALALGGPVGCSDNDPVVPDPVDDSYPWPDTPDALMVNFARAYEEMDMEEYEVALHADFAFVFIHDAAIWDRAADLASTDNMFSGQPGINPDSSYRDPVQIIAVNLMDRDGPWEDVLADDPHFPGTVMAVHTVQVVFTLLGGENTITVQSDQEFYVRAVDAIRSDGPKRDRYYLVGQRDLIKSRKGNEDLTWGSIKTLYIPQDVPAKRSREYLVGQRDLLDDSKANEAMSWGELKSLFRAQNEPSLSR